jgi:hypothetical protein
MTRARVHDVYRHKHTGHLIPGPRTFVEYHPHGRLSVTYCCGKRLSARAVSIATTSAAWVTDKGIGVGDSELKLTGSYPVTCHTDVPGPTGVDVACTLQDGERWTTFHVSQLTPETPPQEIYIDGVQVYFGTPPGV